jgi:hypothetical protein
LNIPCLFGYRALSNLFFLPDSPDVTCPRHSSKPAHTWSMHQWPIGMCG